MQTTETTRRAYRTKSQKIELLNELQSGGMTISILARKHGIHPVTIHKWKRDMSQETKKDSVDVHEVMKELNLISILRGSKVSLSSNSWSLWRLLVFY